MTDLRLTNQIAASIKDLQECKHQSRTLARRASGKLFENRFNDHQAAAMNSLKPANTYQRRLEMEQQHGVNEFVPLN